MQSEDYRSVPCPDCGAIAGEACRNDGVVFTTYHVFRVRDFMLERLKR